jgi:hypothetical protein
MIVIISQVPSTNQNASLDDILYVQLPYSRTQHYYAGQTWLSICHALTLQNVLCFPYTDPCNNDYSSVNGRFRVETNEVSRVHVHSSLPVVTSNQNAASKKKYRLNIYPKPGMSHYNWSDSWITDILRI